MSQYNVKLYNLFWFRRQLLKVRAVSQTKSRRKDLVVS